MSKTAVGLFENPGVAHQVVHDLDASAFPGNEIRILGEPRDMAVTGLMSTPHTDFEVALDRDLRSMGVSDVEADAYVQGVRRGGVLVFATGSNAEVDGAVVIMNHNGATEMDRIANVHQSLGNTIGGARMFTW